MKPQLTFHGGAGQVTGSNFLLEYENKKVLVDCGFFQGCFVCEDKNLEPFPYDPKAIDVVFVTHAHVDHTGRLPKLVKEGFSGRIISTSPTKDIARLMLEDSLSLLEEEAREKGRPLIYGKEDVEKTLSLWETMSYHEEVPITKTLTGTLRNSGHILGSAMVEFRAGGKKLVITGDLGNSPDPLLPDAEAITDVNYLVIESVYGDRNHENLGRRKDILEDVIEETIRKEGVLMIPAFSIERTQEVLYEIETMIESRRIPKVPVFLDSPLATRVTGVYRLHREYLKQDVKEARMKGEEPFAFPELTVTYSPEESKAIAHAPSPKIIIAGSGMSNGGRILFHEKRYLPEPRNTLLFVGYQAPGSLGREIQDGAKKVVIHDSEVPVRARLRTIEGYSGHKDLDRLIDYVSHTADTLEETFVVMGEPKSSAFLAQRLRDYMGVDAKVPAEGESIGLEF